MSEDENEKDVMFLNPPVEQKLKILALHGYRQNANVFRAKTGAFRKMVRHWANFTFITAPHKVLPVEKLDDCDVQVEETSSDQHGWFFNRNDMTYRGIREGGPAIGYEESIGVVQKAFEEFGPFDGILGFSQGGCMTGLLADLQQRQMLNFSFKFVIIISGFKSKAFPHMEYYNENISLPALFIYGLSDEIIPSEMTKQLGEIFIPHTFVEHSGKHWVPASKNIKNPLLAFLTKRFLAIKTNSNNLEDSEELINT